MNKKPKVGKVHLNQDGEPEFLPNRDLGRFTIKPLTKEIAKQLGHVAWIEERDPALALQRMMEAVQTPPYNCAVWANADAGEAPGWRGALHRWRLKNHFGFLSNVAVGDKQRHFGKLFTIKGEAISHLRSQFARAAVAPPSSLRQHMERRLSDLFRLAAFDGCRFQLRGKKDDVTADFVTDHIDGTVKDGRLRFIETLDGPGTYLFDNKDAVPYDQNGPTFGLPHEGEFVAYETPATSLTLLTDRSLPWQPVLHGEPFLPPHQTPQRRVVAVYDVKMR